METAARIELTCFAVGQGLGNLAEFYNKEGALIFLAIFDFGCFNASGAKAPESLQYVKTKMKERCQIEQEKKGSEYQGGAFLDLVVISHQDEDHWQLLNKILLQHNLFSKYKLRENDCLIMQGRTTHLILRDKLNGEEIWKASALPEDAINVFQETNWTVDQTILSANISTEITCSPNEQIYKYSTCIHINVPRGKKTQNQLKNIATQIENLSSVWPFCKATVKNYQLDGRSDKVHIIICGQFDIKGTATTYSRSIFVENRDELATERTIYNMQEYGDYNLERETYTVKKLEGGHKNFQAEFLPASPPPQLIDERIANMHDYLAQESEGRPANSLVIRQAVVGGDIGTRSSSFHKFLAKLKRYSISAIETGDGVYNAEIPSPLKNIKFYIVRSLTTTGSFSAGSTRPPTGEEIASTAILRNYSSAVVLMIIIKSDSAYSCGVLFPGDATSHTLNYINRHCIRKAGEINRVSWPFLNHVTKMQLCYVPHHGSGKTNQGYTLGQHSQEAPDNFEIFRRFVNTLASDCFQTSSGQCKKNQEFHHPDCDILEIIDSSPGIVSETDTHTLRAWHAELSDDEQSTSYSLEEYTTNKQNYGTSVILEKQPRYVHHHYIFNITDKDIDVTHIAEEDLPSYTR